MQLLACFSHSLTRQLGGCNGRTAVLGGIAAGVSAGGGRASVRVRIAASKSQTPCKHVNLRHTQRRTPWRVTHLVLTVTTCCGTLPPSATLERSTPDRESCENGPSSGRLADPTLCTSVTLVCRESNRSFISNDQKKESEEIGRRDGGSQAETRLGRRRRRRSSCTRPASHAHVHAPGLPSGIRHLSKRVLWYWREHTHDRLQLSRR